VVGLYPLAEVSERILYALVPLELSAPAGYSNSVLSCNLINIIVSQPLVAVLKVMFARSRSSSVMYGCIVIYKYF
jgi:hypothetical protein